MSARLTASFARCKARDRAAFIGFIMGGDPCPAEAEALLLRLPEAGVDIVELGMPFSDPMADGPAIQAAGQRALTAGTTLHDIFAMAAAFRNRWPDVPLVLMGYLNPVLHYGPEAFAAEAARTGVDGVILVDLPHEEADCVAEAFERHGLARISLITPATPEARMHTIADQAEGFLYFVSIAGITGTQSADIGALSPHLARLGSMTDLPIAVGFGIRTPEQTAQTGAIADGVVVGSAIVSHIAAQNEAYGSLPPEAQQKILEEIRTLSGALSSSHPLKETHHG